MNVRWPLWLILWVWTTAGRRLHGSSWLHSVWSACVGVNREKKIPSAVFVSRMKKDTGGHCGKRIRKSSRNTTQNTNRAGPATLWAWTSSVTWWVRNSYRLCVSSLRIFTVSLLVLNIFVCFSLETNEEFRTSCCGRPKFTQDLPKSETLEENNWVTSMTD